MYGSFTTLLNKSQREFMKYKKEEGSILSKEQTVKRCTDLRVNRINYTKHLQCILQKTMLHIFEELFPHTARSS